MIISAMSVKTRHDEFGRHTVIFGRRHEELRPLRQRLIALKYPSELVITSPTANGGRGQTEVDFFDSHLSAIVEAAYEVCCSQLNPARDLYWEKLPDFVQYLLKALPRDVIDTVMRLSPDKRTAMRTFVQEAWTDFVKEKK